MMLKQLEVDALKADLAAVSSLLEGRSEEEDPIGYMQFAERKSWLEQQLSEVQDRHQALANVALFFGGRPVVGSRGIVADFGTKAIEQFQNVVAARFAARDGAVGSRGPIRQRDQTRMLITDVARGSFGFVLEEVGSDQTTDSDLKEVVNDVVELIYHTADADTEAFDEAISTVYDRVLASIQSFFRLIDDAGATLRLVEDEKDLLLPRDAVERARDRVENISLDDTTKILRGRLFFIPSSRKFELERPSGEYIKGTITPECLRSLTSETGEIGAGTLGTWCKVELQIREVRLRGQRPRYSYKLLRVLASGQPKPIHDSENVTED
jgi:hypothetical protein